jgi:lipoprotein NlpI
MRRLFLFGFLLLVCASAQRASAAAYDDFARGLAANQQQESAIAIPAFTAALAAGDLSASLKPNAYYGRALANLRSDNCAAALSDAQAALTLLPNYKAALYLHASANECLGQFALALAEDTALIAADSTAGSYFNRGGLSWHMGNFSAAAADFKQAVQLAPKSSYGVIWLALVQARSGALDSAFMKHALSPLDDDDWPAPIVMLVAGKSTPDAVAAAAAHGDVQTVPRQVCEADFYVAEWWLARADAASARPLLARAAANCPHNFLEYRYARIELARLK